MRPKKKITFIHLLNDYSGSPLVLANVINGLSQEAYECKIITSGNTEGFLSNLKDVQYDFFDYRFKSNKLHRLLLFIRTQVILFFKIWNHRKDQPIIYINTLLPFGAAIAAKLTGQKVIYHIHEISLKPQMLKGFLKWIANRTASYSIFVSEHLRKHEKLSAVKNETIHNALSDAFIAASKQVKAHNKSSLMPFNVLMLCSLKAYKGVDEFVKLSKMLPDIQFTMIVNAQAIEIEDYFKNTALPANIKLYPSQKNVHPFYQNAHLVVNLSHPEQWVETFGMTLLEGMQYGLPCIAPPVGGPAEIVDHAVNGYLIDQRNLALVAEKITTLANDKFLYQQFSKNAFKRSQDFNHESKITSIKGILIAEF